MSDLKEIFLQNIPLIDVRAPSEFKDGHFPASVNLPIMNDEERHLVGVKYKTAGQEKAIQLGHELVSGAVKQDRIRQWMNFVEQHPNAKMYCFRGGLRSHISGQWLKEARGAGAPAVEVIPGGYKRLRRFLIDTLEQASEKKELILLTGRTGVGKTKFLRSHHMQASMIDLEKLADHKGSAFGALGEWGYQPAQITFENRLAIDLLRLEGAASLVLEDESRSIGACSIPQLFFERMRASPVVILEKTWEERVAHIVEEYVDEKTRFYLGDFFKTEAFLLGALGRIQKRLGGLRHQEISDLIRQAFASTVGTLVERHASWVDLLLKYYYDPLYDDSLKMRAPKILFRGGEKECFDFFSSQKNGGDFLGGTGRPA